jgi:predicted transcriptional regulator
VIDMSDATFTFRVNDELKSEFSKAARSRDRSSAQLLRDFMREYVQQQQRLAEHESWFKEQVNQGLDSANAGNLVPANDVEAKFSARRALTQCNIDKQQR